VEASNGDITYSTPSAAESTRALPEAGFIKDNPFILLQGLPRSPHPDVEEVGDHLGLLHRRAPANHLVPGARLRDEFQPCHDHPPPSIGALVRIPLFNRNQGNLRRAEHAVMQTRIELSGLEKQAVSAVERAALDSAATRAAAERIERGILPRARRLRDRKYALCVQGQENIVSYLNAQRDYNEVVRQYRDALIRHRRSMLRLNTAVGQRVLP
jgi:cobalt-zinc-cadmium efflux system outer membrane protein